jgi:hypothetical protein
LYADDPVLKAKSRSELAQALQQLLSHPEMQNADARAFITAAVAAAEAEAAVAKAEAAVAKAEGDLADVKPLKDVGKNSGSISLGGQKENVGAFVTFGISSEILTLCPEMEIACVWPFFFVDALTFLFPCSKTQASSRRR